MSDAMAEVQENQEELLRIDEGGLPPHLAKFFDKKGNLKPDAAKRMTAGDRKRLASRSKDVTPKGYGPKEEVEIEEGIGSLKNAKRDTERMRKASGHEVKNQTTTKTSGGTLRKTTYKDAKEILRKRKEKTREMEKKARSSYLEPDMKKRQKNNEKARKDMEKMAPKMRNPHLEQVEIDELSNDTLASYKTKAAAQASAADKAGNFKKADKRFSGITRATNKQFDNDAKEVIRKRAEKTREMERKMREDVDKLHAEAILENSKMNENFDWKVQLRGLPVFYVPAKSAGEVRAMLRRQIKKPDDILSIERSTKAEKKKDFRDRISGKESEE
jgi:hypothetical protein